MHPEVLPLVREALEFRYRLLPYMYSLIFETVRRGDPVIRPLLYEFPGDPRCRTESFAFLLGPNLLAAPLTEPGARRRRVYLPSGTAWIEVPSGLRHEGGKDAEVEAPLEKLPLFAPEGAVIPLGEVPAPGGPLKEDRRFALVFPHRKEGRGTFTLIEDDGLTLDYVKGAFTEVILSVESRPDQIILEAKTGRRGYPLPYREIEFILPPEEDRPVCGGKENGTDAEGRRRAAVHILS
jgi:alpha-glucosidase